MSEIRITFISEGFKAILTGEGVKGVVETATKNIEAKANANLTAENSEGYEGDVVMSPRMSNYSNGGRWVGFVRATDYEAMVDEAENKSLSRAVTG